MLFRSMCIIECVAECGTYLRWPESLMMCVEFPNRYQRLASDRPVSEMATATLSSRIHRLGMACRPDSSYHCTDYTYVLCCNPILKVDRNSNILVTSLHATRVKTIGIAVQPLGLSCLIVRFKWEQSDTPQLSVFLAVLSDPLGISVRITIKHAYHR